MMLSAIIIYIVLIIFTFQYEASAFISRATSIQIHDKVLSALWANSPSPCDDYGVLMNQVQKVAGSLWDGNEIPTAKDNPGKEGEAQLMANITFSQRADFFRKLAMDEGCPKAQHSYGLLLWSGFGGVQRDAKESAKFHAAAAVQGHLDGIAVLGGCLRTNTGIGSKKKEIKHNAQLGLNLIDYSASRGNPTGINKKAALLEANQDHFDAVDLYEKSIERGTVNALLLFNLGWCLIHGQGVLSKDLGRGIELWKQAAQMAPDEGSEEAAWYLYQELERDYPQEANQWLKLAQDLGFHEDY